jgi:hypothetical protein
MPFLRLLAGAVLLASAGEGSPLTISSGDVLVQATGVVYLDPFSSILVQGFFGSVDSIPSNAVGGGLVRLEGDHSGTISSGPHSNLQDVVLSFNRGMPSATGGVSFTSTSDAALADTVLTLLNGVTFGGLESWDVDFGFQPFTMHSLTPFSVHYGDQPGAPIRYFDAKLSVAATGGPGTSASTLAIRTIEYSGQFFAVGEGLATHGTLTFTNPEMGTFSTPVRLRGELGSGSWTVTPEPGSGTLLTLGAICLAARWRVVIRRVGRVAHRKRTARSGGGSQSTLCRIRAFEITGTAH